MKFCLLLSAITVVTARNIFGDRTRIKYGFEDYGAYVEQAGTAAYIVVQDTGSDKWSCNKALPPTCYPPPLTHQAISAIKDLEGLEVEVIGRRQKDL